MKRGLIPAAFTPFSSDFTLNLNAIPHLASLYLNQGCETVFINGTTGEFASMTLNERIVVAESWIDKTKGMSVWVHVGHPSQFEAIQLARHAQSIGAEAISALAPYYFTPGTVTHLVDFLVPIAEAATNLPFYYYHIPSMTHSELDMAAFITQAIDRIPNFTGLKFSSPDLYSLQKAKMAADKAGRTIEVLFGVDEMLLGTLPFDIDGAIGSTYNFAAALYHQMLGYYHQDLPKKAQRLQSDSVALVNEFHTYGGISTGKAILKMLGVDCGPPRPPLPTLSVEEQKTLYQKISPLEIFPNQLQSPETI